jgi:hypothetical protein
MTNPFPCAELVPIRYCVTGPATLISNAAITPLLGDSTSDLQAMIEVEECREQVVQITTQLYKAPRTQLIAGDLMPT